ncbi:MAG: hypothetical protein J2P17_25715 [Mycobacterium sp.]|nr:hypothetical protein [Mycobacterium sp.]
MFEHLSDAVGMSAGRDAELLPWRRVTEAALPGGNRHIWVRLEGVWCEGSVVFWQRDPGGWAMWVQHELPHSTTDWTWHEWVRYDPVTVRLRDGREPPAS